MGNFLTKIKLKIVLMTAAVGIALSSCYSFTGSSLSPETKTILIKNFPKKMTALFLIKVRSKIQPFFSLNIPGLVKK